MMECWNESNNRRPSFGELRNKLQGWSMMSSPAQSSALSSAIYNNSSLHHNHLLQQQQMQIGAVQQQQPYHNGHASSAHSGSPSSFTWNSIIAEYVYDYFLRLGSSSQLGHLSHQGRVAALNGHNSNGAYFGANSAMSLLTAANNNCDQQVATSITPLVATSQLVQTKANNNSIAINTKATTTMTNGNNSHRQQRQNGYEYSDEDGDDDTSE